MDFPCDFNIPIIINKFIEISKITNKQEYIAFTTALNYIKINLNLNEINIESLQLINNWYKLNYKNMYSNCINLY